MNAADRVTRGLDLGSGKDRTRPRDVQEVTRVVRRPKAGPCGLTVAWFPAGP